MVTNVSFAPMCYSVLKQIKQINVVNWLRQTINLQTMNFQVLDKQQAKKSTFCYQVRPSTYLGTCWK